MCRINGAVDRAGVAIVAIEGCRVGGENDTTFSKVGRHDQSGCAEDVARQMSRMPGGRDRLSCEEG